MIGFLVDVAGTGEGEGKSVIGMGASVDTVGTTDGRGGTEGFDVD